MTGHVAVIDLGKTNSKIALVDTAAAEEVSVIKQASTVNTGGMYPSLDHQAIEAFVFDSLSYLSSTYKIDAITVTAHGATAALIDSSGKLALPVIDYEFRGIDELSDEYDVHRPSFAETGSPKLPGGLNIGAQLYWQQTKFPSQFASTRCILTWPQYWTNWLGGQRYNDVTSLGSHTDLFDPRQNRYSSLVEAMGWHSLMPAAIRPGKSSGTLDPALAKRVGLSPTIPIFSGIHDSNASLVPHLLTQSSPFTVVSTGTWFIVMAIGGTPIELDEHRDTLLNVNAMGQCVPSARFMGGRERELSSMSSEVNEDALKKLLSNTETPSMFMPSVVQGTGPYPNATSTWIGASCRDEPEVHDCALALYLALMTHECMEMIGSAGPTFIEGPLAQDRQYAQMLTAISERPVLISDSETGTSIGAAMLISPPDNPPKCRSVSLDQSRREQLMHYAMLWRQNLEVHAK